MRTSSLTIRSFDLSRWIFALPFVAIGLYGAWHYYEWQGDYFPDSGNVFISLTSIAAIYGVSFISLIAFQVRGLARPWLAIWLASASVLIVAVSFHPSPLGLFITSAALVAYPFGTTVKSIPFMLFAIPLLSGALFGLLIFVIQRTITSPDLDRNLLKRHLIGGAITGFLFFLLLPAKNNAAAVWLPFLALPCLLPHFLASMPTGLYFPTTLSRNRVLIAALTFCAVAYLMPFLDLITPGAGHRNDHRVPTGVVSLLAYPLQSFEIQNFHPRPGRPSIDVAVPVGTGWMSFAKGEAIHWRSRHGKTTYYVRPKLKPTSKDFPGSIVMKIHGAPRIRRPDFRSIVEGPTRIRCRTDIWDGVRICRDSGRYTTNPETGKRVSYWFDALPAIDEPDLYLDPSTLGPTSAVMMFAKSDGMELAAHCDRLPRESCRISAFYRGPGDTAISAEFTLPATELPSLMAITAALDHWFTARTAGSPP